MEGDLETAQEKIEQLKVLEESEEERKKENESSQRKISLLEQELEASEKTVRETTKK